MKKMFLILLMSIYALSYELKLDSNLNALKLADNSLLIGLDNGEIKQYFLKDKKMQKITQLDKIKNFYEENLSPRIYSIDYLNGAILILSEGDFGSKKLYVYKNKQLLSYDLANDGAKKALFLDDNTILLALLGSNIELFDLKTKSVVKNFTFSSSSLSDVVLNETKTQLVAGFESGELMLFDVKKWQKIKSYKNIHKDNIYQLDFKNTIIASCSTDRKLGIVQNDQEKNIERDFLIYTCALNENGSIAAFGDNEKNIIELVNTKNLKTIKRFQNKDFLLEYLIFLNEHELISAGYEDKIIFWSIDESF
ncbi:WD40 repeat domain-containing protein [Campylobacter sp. IFREMER_LSEM_CL2127]|uniref:WD40 repeat domain-containing protein n=1 Tax=unclassified Campylobacter TaxID=2593542 RepID=UPI0021E66B06|nr:MULTISPECIES: WD40 repeat domain-containing protein [unclassified Campylobacter]MCV3381026.1 WD40 repeat domain-containing protein [Campylobacter sp. IFREMER_LSEM_CL2127]MCV3471644.1 WD40 repeat domain-containing protein [Campylobacter sp. CNRCH_2015_0338h]MCV3481983.1 WD40 repeat domain-containing protein [Campylobacter sp. CNRCH_2014_0184h]HEC1774473.1 WD40 repeat domain-containing protein [Campylobacter lari]